MYRKFLEIKTSPLGEIKSINLDHVLCITKVDKGTSFTFNNSNASIMSTLESYSSIKERISKSDWKFKDGLIDPVDPVIKNVPTVHNPLA